MSNKWHDKARKDERGASTRPDARAWSAPWYYEISSHPLIHKAFREFRITHYNNNQPNFYTEKVGSAFVVNVRLIKIEIDRLSIIQTLNEHIFENVQRCGSIWDCKVCAKRSLKHVEKN